MEKIPVRVLLVEDDEDDYIIIQQLLKNTIDLSCELTWKDRYEAGVKEMCHGTYDVCLLDYRLGQYNGIRFLKDAARLGCHLPIILLTGQGDHNTDLEAMQAGASDYLVKDQLSKDLLERAIRYSIKSKQAEQKLREAHDRLELIVQARTQELAKANDALVRSEAWLHSILETIPDIIYRLDPMGHITFVSDAIRSYGLDPGTLIHKPILDLVHPEDRHGAIYKINERRTGARSTKSFEVRLLLEDQSLTNGKMYTFLISAEGLYASERSSTATFKGTQGIARDITNRKRAENEKMELLKQLQKAQKLEAIGTLAGGIAHDFNNLLMGIQGRTSLLLMDEIYSASHHEHLKDIEEYVEKGADLTNQLLGFARGGKYQVKPTDINKVIKGQNRIFAHTDKAVTISANYEDNVWKVKVDRSQIEQVLLNLYVNAGQAMPDGGSIYVSTRNIVLQDEFAKSYGVRPGKYVKISVVDTGTGMDESLLTRIFDPFFTTKELGRGTGLGLASAYGIIKNHNGIITADSEKGKGSTFEIYLPACDEAAPKEDKLLDSKVLKGTETILLVDDEKLIIEVCKEAMESFGYGVLTAKSGKEAIGIYERNWHSIDMVILDMIMPEMSGGETFDNLKKINPNVKVLLSTGFSFNGEAQKVLDRGCKGFIQKPFKMAKLSKIMRKILDEDQPVIPRLRKNAANA